MLRYPRLSEAHVPVAVHRPSPGEELKGTAEKRARAQHNQTRPQLAALAWLGLRALEPPPPGPAPRERHLSNPVSQSVPFLPFRFPFRSLKSLFAGIQFFTFTQTQTHTSHRIASRIPPQHNLRDYTDTHTHTHTHPYREIIWFTWTSFVARI